MGPDLFLRRQREVGVWQGCGSTCDLRICLNEDTASTHPAHGGLPAPPAWSCRKPLAGHVLLPFWVLGCPPSTPWLERGRPMYQTPLVPHFKTSQPHVPLEPLLQQLGPQRQQ